MFKDANTSEALWFQGGLTVLRMGDDYTGLSSNQDLPRIHNLLVDFMESPIPILSHVLMLRLKTTTEQPPENFCHRQRDLRLNLEGLSPLVQHFKVFEHCESLLRT